MTGIEAKLAEQIASLEVLSRQDLIAEWVRRYGSEPYKGIRKASLTCGIAYHMQAKVLGGLKASTSKQLLKAAGGRTSDASIRQDHQDRRQYGHLQTPDQQCAQQPTHLRQVNQVEKRRAKPRTQLGTRLVREWNGRTYEVVVADKGYVLNGVTHPSLSACAKAITGAHWSGPRFFGVAS